MKNEIKLIVKKVFNDTNNGMEVFRVRFHDGTLASIDTYYTPEIGERVTVELRNEYTREAFFYGTAGRQFWGFIKYFGDETCCLSVTE